MVLNLLILSKRFVTTLAILSFTELSACTELVNELARDMCRSSELERIPSPDNKIDAVVFNRDCGASTGFISSVVLLEHSSPLSKDHSESFFAANGYRDAAPAKTHPMYEGGGPRLTIKWKSSNLLSISFPKDTRISHQDGISRNVTVTYSTLGK